MSQDTIRVDESPTTGRRVLATVAAMSLPVVINNVSRTLMNFVDFAMVSELGTDAQAAITPAVLLSFSVIGIALGATTSTNTFAAQSVGRGRSQDAARYTWQSVWLGMLFGILAAPLIGIVPVVTQWFGHAPAVRALENEYLQIILLSAGPTAVAYGFSNFFIGVHRPWLGCVATIVANIFNIFANWVLIFGHLGFPAMGIGGAAVGTVLATFVQCGVSLAFFWSGPFRRQFQTHRALRWEPRKAWQLLRVGLPTGMHFLGDITAWALFVSAVVGTRFGTAQLAATNIIFQYLHLSFMPAVGIGMALAAMTGKAIGARDYALAERQVRHATAVCMGYMGSCGLVFLLARRPLIALLTDDPVVIGVGASLFVWAALFQVFDGLGIAAMNALRGAGDTFLPSVYNAALEWTILIGGGFVVGWLWPAGGAIGPWMMATAYIIVVGLVWWTRFARGGWRKINIFRHESEADELPPGVQIASAPSATGPIDPLAPTTPAVALED